jgi:hypothetical protein
LQLQTVELRVGARSGVQSGRLQELVALTHGALEGAEPRAVTGIKTQDQPVEEPAPVTGRPHEQAVHRRQQPDHVDVVGEHAGARHGLPVDANGAAGGAGFVTCAGGPARTSPGRQACPDFKESRRRLQARGDRPAPVPAKPRQLGEGRPAQALARSEQGHGLQQVGLAGAVGAGQHDRFRTKIEGEARMAAEIGQRQPLDPAAGEGRGSLSHR